MKPIYLLSFLVFFTSCGTTPPTQYQKDGVSFTSPAGWKITSEIPMGSYGHYLTIEKKGFSSSGLMTLNWLNERQDLKEWIKELQDGLKENYIFKKANLSFEDVKTVSYGTYQALESKYTASVFGVDHEGSIIVFGTKTKSVHILQQGATEDRIENEIGFEAIEGSFTCK